jgi:hypothetical protein
MIRKSVKSISFMNVRLNIRKNTIVHFSR